MANNKAIIGGVTAIVLVAAVIGVIATISSSPDHADGNPNSDLSATSKSSVSAICSPTDYKDSCERTLTKSLNGSADPKSIIQAIVTATIDQVTAAMHGSGNLTATLSDPRDKNAMEDCKKLFDDATDDLHAVLKLAESETDFSKRSDDINTWLTAVIAYQTSCVEGFGDPDVKDYMEKNVEAATQFTSNALALFQKYSSVLKSFDIGGLVKGSSGGANRRLLRYPSWISAGDRRLLRGNAGVAPPRVTPNVVVAKDGSGQFKTISQAIAAMPKTYQGRYVIYVKAGVYNEQVLITKEKPNIFMYGDGARKTIVTDNKSVMVHKISTSNTATFAVEALGFIAKDMGFSNTAGPVGEQAVALRVKADMVAFFNCRMDAYQDTLYVQANRQFYRNCVISGTVDFIFGDSATVLQNCLIIVRNPGQGQRNMVTAQGRKERTETSAIVIQNCRIVPEKRLFAERLTIPTYLGRPWKAFSRTIVMESELGDLIRPEGWAPWDGSPEFQETLYYAEYNNRGPGANTAGRVKWGGYRGVISRQEAQAFTPGSYIDTENWIGKTGATYFRGFKN